MSTPPTREDIELQIETMMAVVGVSKDRELANILGLDPAAISQWRRRRSVPKSALRKVAAFAPRTSALCIMQERRSELGHHLLYEGLCLAIWLAPSLDAFGKRFGPAAFTGALRQYASYLPEIELACAEQVAEFRDKYGGNATDAFERLTREDPVTLYDRILDRAHWWRDGEGLQDQPGSPTLHDPPASFKGFPAKRD